MARDAFSLDVARAEAILPRYAIEGPRYTSYPTAPVWKENFGVEQFEAELARGAAEASSLEGEGDGLSLYVHVPFCRSLCHFCACNRIITSNAELRCARPADRAMPPSSTGVAARRPTSRRTR